MLPLVRNNVIQCEWLVWPVNVHNEKFIRNLCEQLDLGLINQTKQIGGRNKWKQTRPVRFTILVHYRLFSVSQLFRYKTTSPPTLGLIFDVIKINVELTILRIMTHQVANERRDSSGKYVYLTAMTHANRRSRMSTPREANRIDRPSRILFLPCKYGTKDLHFSIHHWSTCLCPYMFSLWLFTICYFVPPTSFTTGVYLTTRKADFPFTNWVFIHWFNVVREPTVRFVDKIGDFHRRRCYLSQ